MKRLIASFGIFVLAAGAGSGGRDGPAEHWLHIRVEDGKVGEEGRRSG